MIARFTALALLTALLAGCGNFQQDAPETREFPFELPTYYGLYAIQGDTLIDLQDAPGELPSAVQFLYHHKSVLLAADADNLAFLMLDRRSETGDEMPWPDWHERHRLPPAGSPQFQASLPVIRNLVPVRTRPVRGQPEMIIIEPRGPLPPGPYQLGEGLRFWVNRNAFAQTLVKRVEEAAQAQAYQAAYDLAELVKLWAHDSLDLRKKMMGAQAKISRIAADSAMKTGTWEDAEKHLAHAASLGGDATLSPEMAANVSFLKAVDLAKEQQWGEALVAAKRALDAARPITEGSKKAYPWPKRAGFRSPLSVIEKLVNHHAEADPAAVCEATQLLVQGDPAGLKAKLAEVIGLAAQESDAHRRMAEEPYLCIAGALVDLRAEAAVPMLSSALERVLKNVNPSAGAPYVAALTALDRESWKPFRKEYFNKLYENFQYMRDLGPSAHRLDPIDRKVESSAQVLAFLRRLGRWDPKQGKSLSGLEFDSRVPTFRIVSREHVEITYQLAGSRAEEGDRYTLVIKAVKDSKLPWRIVNVKHVVIGGKSWTGSASELAAVAEPPVAREVANSATTAPLIAAAAQPITAVPLATAAGANATTRAISTTVSSVVCPTSRPSREYGFGAWHRCYYKDQTLVDMSPTGKRSKREHTEVREVVQAGLDLEGREGSPVFSIGDGVVVQTVEDPTSLEFKQDGYAVVVKHAKRYGGRQIYTLYAHLQERPLVVRGDTVEKGKTQMGKMGKTGATLGPKVHLEARYFEDLFDMEMADIYGNPKPQTKDSFNHEYFDQNWLDPARLLEEPSE